jgi:hypothetical protein
MLNVTRHRRLTLLAPATQDTVRTIPPSSVMARSAVSSAVAAVAAPAAAAVLLVCLLALHSAAPATADAKDKSMGFLTGSVPWKSLADARAGTTQPSLPRCLLVT